MRLIIDDCHERARGIILQNRDKLDAIARALLEREVLDGKEIEMLINGQQLPPLTRPASSAESRAKAAPSEERPAPIPGRERLRPSEA